MPRRGGGVRLGEGLALPGPAEVKEALYAALTMPPEEGRKRMRTLRKQVMTHDVDRWARSFLAALGLEPADG